MALSAAYFVGEIMIPNISGSSIIETANLNTLNIFIAKYEPYFLEMLLGETLADAYTAGIAVGSPETRWTTLRDQIYQTNQTLSIGFSPAANYVYIKYAQNANSLSLTNTEAKPLHENVVNYTSREKIVKAWNEMVRMIEVFREWLDDNTDDYPEYDQSEITDFERTSSHGI